MDDRQLDDRGGEAEVEARMQLDEEQELHHAGLQDFDRRRRAFPACRSSAGIAAAKAIRSWTFDSNGTFAEATWEHRGGRWFIRNRGTLPDGRTATMINVMKPVDENSFTWQTIERTAGGELLPNIDEMLIVRQ